jgi:hypothetical protein
MTSGTLSQSRPVANTFTMSIIPTPLPNALNAP